MYRLMPCGRGRSLSLRKDADMLPAAQDPWPPSMLHGTFLCVAPAHSLVRRPSGCNFTQCETIPWLSLARGSWPLAWSVHALVSTNPLRWARTYACADDLTPLAWRTSPPGAGTSLESSCRPWLLASGSTRCYMHPFVFIRLLHTTASSTWPNIRV